MDLFNRLLTYYQITESEYNKRIEDSNLLTIPNPFQYMDGFKEAIDLIEKHIANHSKIVVLGDYDVDGLTSTSILVMALKKRGVEPGFYVPSRYIDGYGISEKRVDDIKKANYDLIITTDNGISAFKPIKKARELGIDVVVVDHHTVQNELPKANAIVHHKLGKYGDLEISAGFLALLVSFGLNGEYDEYSAALAGLAVISDMMPMKGSNLNLVKHLLKVVAAGKYAQFNYLLCGNPRLFINKKMITSTAMSFDVVAPLNALGRMDIGLGNNNAVRFLASDDPVEINKYYQYIVNVSNKKKERLRDLRKISNQPVKSVVDVRVISDCEVGLVGALANNQMFSIKKPVILFTKSPTDPEVLVGSGRSLTHVDFYSIVKKYSEKFISFGGHRNAFGLSIKASDFLYFRECMVKEFLQLKQEKPQDVLVEISEDEINSESLDIIDAFGPFGTDFNYPHLVVKTKRKNLKLSKNPEHIYTRLPSGSVLTYFNYDKFIDDDINRDLYLVGSLSLNEFKGRSNIQFQANSVADIRIDKIIN